MSGKKEMHELRLDLGEGMESEVIVGDTQPVFVGQDREDPIGFSEIVIGEDGKKEILVRLDMSHPKTSMVLGRFSKADDVSMGSKVAE